MPEFEPWFCVLMSLAGMCARRRSNFLLSRQEKVTKEKATLLSVTPSLRYGATCGARSRGALRNSLRAARSVRTNAASQFTKHGRSDAHATPAPALLGTGRRAPATRAIASLGPAFAARSACALGAERSDGPYRFHPLLAAPGAGGLRGGRRVVARLLRELTRCVCPNGAPQARSELRSAPRKPAAPGLPLRAAKGPQTAGRLFFGNFLFAQKESYCAAGRTSRPATFKRTAEAKGAAQP